jgi:hypothetical protein
VLSPYLNGQDLNTRPDCSASRWVIDFHDWDQERAKQYAEAYERVQRMVRPERATNRRKGRRDRWWQFAERAPALLKAIAGMERVLVQARISKTVMPVFVAAGTVFNEKIVVFASDDPSLLSVLASAPHYWWSVTRSSTMKSDLNYAPSDVFEAFPRPRTTPDLHTLGTHLDTRRHEIMLRRGSGLTATYNLVHDEICTDPGIAELRDIHRAIDEEVARAYGWHDILAQPGSLDHGFHETRQGPRYTVGPIVRQEILDRLLEENQRRHMAEMRSGSHQLRLPAQTTPAPPTFASRTADRTSVPEAPTTGSPPTTGMGQSVPSDGFSEAAFEGSQLRTSSGGC